MQKSLFAPIVKWISQSSSERLWRVRVLLGAPKLYKLQCVDCERLLNIGEKMARDVKIWKDDGAFKLRTCGVVEIDGKYLIGNSGECDFWSFPGGHVTIGESTDDAVVREFFEETKIETEIEKLLADIQLFWDRGDGKPFHEVGFYYLLKPKHKIEAKDFVYEENDGGEIKHHVYKWLTLDELKNIDIRPLELLICLENNLERQHFVHNMMK